MANWTEDTEDQMITMIHERPALYDVTEKRYANRVVKKQLWREIENKLVISEKELRRRWDSLRTQYSRYKKLAPAGRSGALKTGRQQWILTRLHFLEPHTKRKETTSKRTFRERSAEPSAADSDSPSNSTSSETWNNSSEEPSFFKAELRPCSPPAEPTRREKPPPSTPVPRAKRSRKTPDESASEESKNLMRAISKTLECLATQETQDDISAYCKSVELRMRKLPPHLLPHFQHEVDNCLFKYSVGQSVEVKTPTDGQFAEL